MSALAARAASSAKPSATHVRKNDTRMTATLGSTLRRYQGTRMVASKHGRDLVHDLVEVAVAHFVVAAGVRNGRYVAAKTLVFAENGDGLGERDVVDRVQEAAVLPGLRQAVVNLLGLGIV